MALASPRKHHTNASLYSRAGDAGEYRADLLTVGNSSIPNLLDHAATREADGLCRDSTRLEVLDSSVVRLDSLLHEGGPVAGWFSNGVIFSRHHRRHKSEPGKKKARRGRGSQQKDVVVDRYSRYGCFVAEDQDQTAGSDNKVQNSLAGGAKVAGDLLALGAEDLADFCGQDRGRGRWEGGNFAGQRRTGCGGGRRNERRWERTGALGCAAQAEEGRALEEKVLGAAEAGLGAGQRRIGGGGDRGKAAVEHLEEGEDERERGDGGPDGGREGAEEESRGGGGGGVADVGEDGEGVEGKAWEKVDEAEAGLVGHPAGDAEVAAAVRGAERGALGAGAAG